MSELISVNVNEAEIVKMCKEKIEKLLKEDDGEFVFWDAPELKKRTCMSWNFIQEQFFYDPRFPKRKIGAKWYFPARAARDFLEMWILEQKKY